MTDQSITRISDLLQTANESIKDINENVRKLLEGIYGAPEEVNGSPVVFKTTPTERINRAKRVADGWVAYCNHEDADHISSYALAGIIGVSQPWCLHMLKCRKELIELGKDPKTVPWAEARTVVDR